MTREARRMRLFRPTLAALAAVALVAGRPGVARAHEEGVLKPATRMLSPGDSLSLAGEKFTRNATLIVWVVGVGGRTELARVRTDAKGGFTTRLLVPATVTPGAYRLVAVAADGDEVAGLDVTVVAGAAEAAHDEHEGMAMDEAPTAEPLALEHARSSLVTGAAVGGILLALGLGGVLLRPHRRDAGGDTPS